jgi:hypothetical protein
MSFVHGGGRLLALAYRFGDAFTQSNLGDLTRALGCELNDDAVIDVRALRETHPLQMHFDTTKGSFPLGWSRGGVANVRWRPCATFTLLPDAFARPLALSTGGSCVSYDRTLRRLSFESLPIAVAGRHGAGRLALFGGPHVFESNALGLLSHADNARFLQNVLDWLMSDRVDDAWQNTSPAVALASEWGHDLTRVEAQGQGERTITAVERVLRKTGVLKALNRAKWMP